MGCMGIALVIIRCGKLFMVSQQPRGEEHLKKNIRKQEEGIHRELLK